MPIKVFVGKALTTVTESQPSEPEMPMPLSKRCSVCKKVLPASCFYRCSAAKDGLHTYCKPCFASLDRKRRQRRQARGLRFRRTAGRLPPREKQRLARADLASYLLQVQQAAASISREDRIRRWRDGDRVDVAVPAETQCPHRQQNNGEPESEQR